MAGFVVCGLLLKPWRNGEASVTVIEGEAHALTGCKARLLQLYNRQLHPDEYAQAKKNAKLVADQLGISVQDAEGRIVAEMLRNSDQQTAQASGDKHDYEVRSILGCQNLNCNGYKTDPYYADHNYNSQYIASNQTAYDLGQMQIGTGLTYGGLVASNYDKDPVGNTVARAGASLLAGSVAGGIAVAWGIGAAATYAGDAISYQFNLTPDQPSYQNAATAGAVAGAMSPLLLPLNTLGGVTSGKVAVGIYNSLVAGTGAFGATAMTNPGNSPELSAGIGVVGSLLGSGAQAALPRPIGNVVDIWMQIFSGSAQSAIEQNQRRK